MANMLKIQPLLFHKSLNVKKVMDLGVNKLLPSVLKEINYPAINWTGWMMIILWLYFISLGCTFTGQSWSLQFRPDPNITEQRSQLTSKDCSFIFVYLRFFLAWFLSGSSFLYFVESTVPFPSKSWESNIHYLWSKKSFDPCIRRKKSYGILQH